MTTEGDCRWLNPSLGAPALYSLPQRNPDKIEVAGLHSRTSTLRHLRFSQPRAIGLKVSDKFTGRFAVAIIDSCIKQVMSKHGGAT